VTVTPALHAPDAIVLERRAGTNERGCKMLPLRFPAAMPKTYRLLIAHAGQATGKRRASDGRGGCTTTVPVNTKMNLFLLIGSRNSLDPAAALSDYRAWNP
jgi:hypothetical protein